MVLADPAALMHMALRALFASSPRYSVVAAAENVHAAERLVTKAQPALLVCDVDIIGGSGLDLCRRTRRVSPGTRVVFLTGRDEPRLARSAIAAGATGYLLKDTAPEIIAASLDLITAGEVVMDARLGTSHASSLPIAVLLDGQFSRRESEVLAELSRGLDNKSIAELLCIAEETVKTHVKAVFRKLGARDRAHAVALALGAATATPAPQCATVPPAADFAADAPAALPPSRLEPHQLLTRTPTRR